MKVHNTSASVEQWVIDTKHFREIAQCERSGSFLRRSQSNTDCLYFNFLISLQSYTVNSPDFAKLPRFLSLQGFQHSDNSFEHKKRHKAQLHTAARVAFKI